MKKVIKIHGNTYFKYSGYSKISNIEIYLEEIKHQGYTNISIIYDSGYEEVTFVPYKERLETDAEYAQRLSREADFEEIFELNELRELKRLKEKYEK